MIADGSPLSFQEPFVLICAAIVGTLAVARITRLIVDDAYPPMDWLTDQFARRVPEKWAPLVECVWCVSPYVALPDILWAWGSDLHWSWWLVNVWAAVSWIAGFLGVRDIPPDQRE